MRIIGDIELEVYGTIAFGLIRLILVTQYVTMYDSSNVGILDNLSRFICFPPQLLDYVGTAGWTVPSAIRPSIRASIGFLSYGGTTYPCTSS